MRIIYNRPGPINIVLEIVDHSGPRCNCDNFCRLNIFVLRHNNAGNHSFIIVNAHFCQFVKFLQNKSSRKGKTTSVSLCEFFWLNFSYFEICAAKCCCAVGLTISAAATSTCVPNEILHKMLRAFFATSFFVNISELPAKHKYLIISIRKPKKIVSTTGATEWFPINSCWRSISQWFRYTFLDNYFSVREYVVKKFNGISIKCVFILQLQPFVC